MEWLQIYALFLAKTVTVVGGLAFIIVIIAGLLSREKERAQGYLSITHLNEKFKDLKENLQEMILSKDQLKKLRKKQKEQEKEEKKLEKNEEDRKPRVYVLKFDGDISASQANNLREEITAILQVAEAKDEVVVKLESGGGTVHGYGLAASQLARVRDQGIPLVVAIDKIAASGGYMMACVGQRILAAPFAIVGSIGVVAQFPNFHRLLKKHDIDYEQICAGEYKRTLTMFGQNTPKDREKFQEEIDEAHTLFKNYINQYRPQVDISKVSTGEFWFAKQAMDFNLVDEITTVDSYLLERSQNSDLYQVEFTFPETLKDKLTNLVHVLHGRLNSWFNIAP